MPLPFIVLGASAIAGGTGLITGVNGAKKISEAKDRIRRSDALYNEKRKEFDESEKMTTENLEKLGELKLNIWNDFDKFTNAFGKIKNRPTFEAQKKEDLKIERSNLGEIKQVQITAVELLGTVTAAGGSGALVGLATYGGVMSLGAASTGTAISSLSGIAASNAALAALGGGSLVAGGGGIALGTQVLAGAVAGPILAVSGLLLNKKGSDSIEESHLIQEKVNEAIKLMNESNDKLKKLKYLSIQLEYDLKSFYEKYLNYVEQLEEIVEVKNDYELFTLEEKRILDINIKLVTILYNVTTQNLLKEENGTQKLLEKEVNQILRDSKEIIKQVS
ncbi:hypothetical protein ACMGE7_01960 [Macrococcus equi]|uniref:hypothetical protein n=1 Tax=Macrococcus equi TaxID=3395462 RepID=UPI0039BDAFEE